MTTEEFQLILKRLEAIEEKATRPDQNPEEIWFDNQDLMHFLNISKRTAQNYRDKGLISYSQVAAKIYYRLSDVHAMLERNFNRASTPSQDA